MRWQRLGWVATSAALTVWLGVTPSAQTAARGFEGMWSDAPDSLVGRLCNFVCSDVAIDALNALLDDPANDAVPYVQLRARAQQRHVDHVKSRLTPLALQTFPLDPADDPSFRRCEPWGEWEARRIVYLDAVSPQLPAPSRLGYSVGRWDGQTLVVSTSRIAAGRALVTIDDTFEHSAQLTIGERYTRSEDGKSLLMTATLTDPPASRSL